MTLVLDTGYYLLLAARIGRSSRPLLALAKGAKRLGYELSMSSMAWAECVSHVCHAEPGLPYTAWEHGNAMTFLRHFRHIVSVHPANGDDLLEIAKRLRQAFDPGVASGRRQGPTLADASTAYLVQQLKAEILVTDDLADFRLLLPNFDGEMIAPKQLVDAIG
ncbi:MAG TPA: hypothetical protein VK009_03095 [Chloroflexota bacterium]|nr:hypothetical protein [Chloroflexota bacterium]